MQEPELDDLVDVGFDLVHELGFVAAVGQEDPHQVHQVLPGQHQPRLCAAGIELGQFLAQKGQQQADREGQGPPRDQARKSGRGPILGGVRPALEEGVALGFVQDQIQPQHRHIVPGPGLQAEQFTPQPLVRLPVDHALEQRGKDQRQVGRGRGCSRSGALFFFHHHLTKITRCRLACLCTGEPSLASASQPMGSRISSSTAALPESQPNCR